MLRYPDLALSSTVEEILNQDFWIFRNYNASLFSLSKEAVKFSAYTTLLVQRGSGKAMLSLREIEINAPALVIIHEGEILKTLECSDDLEVSICVLSRRFIDTLVSMQTEITTFSLVHRSSIIPISPDKVKRYDILYDDLEDLLKQEVTPHIFEAAIHTILAFYHRYAFDDFSFSNDNKVCASVRLTETFLQLVKRHFKENRFLDFYAEKLGITRKHLSRVVKEQTGISPVEWIERNVILEAKVLLRSSTLTIQQISDSLNFSSQSFFGKHFKKYTGYTPGEYRNL